MTCDHGISITRYCAACEQAFQIVEVDQPVVREWCRIAAICCLVGMVGIALLAGIRQ